MRLVCNVIHVVEKRQLERLVWRRMSGIYELNVPERGYEIFKGKRLRYTKRFGYETKLMPRKINNS